MRFRAVELLAAWAVAVLIGVLHYAEVSGYNSFYQGLTVPEQKEAWPKTENAFYYSYYEETVEAPSVSAALWAAVRDRRSEAPDTINAIHRFNIYQEIVCGLLFRVAAWLMGREALMDPWYFFRGCSFVLQGLGHVGLMRLAAAIGGDGFLGGVVPGISLACMAFLHRMDFSRISDVGMLELRENWAMPVILCQVWALTKLLLTHPGLLKSDADRPSWEFLGWRWAFRGLTAICILIWQFSAFAFLLQVSAVFLCTLLACSKGARSAMNEVVNSHLISVSVAAVFLFGNELLVHHLLVTQCIAIKTVLWLRASPPRWRVLFWVDGALAVGLFLLLRLLQMPFATADEHVWELYIDKMRTLFPSYLNQNKKEPTFNTRLYNAVSVFDFVSWTTIERGFQTKIYHFAAVALLVQGAAFLRHVLLARGDPSPKGESATDDKKDGFREEAATAYAASFGYFFLLIQTALYLLLGCFISRLKCIGVPFLLLVAATALSPKPLETLIGSFWGSNCHGVVKAVRRSIFILAAVAQLGQLAFLGHKLPFIEGRAASFHSDKSWPEGDRGEFFNWMAKNVPKDEIVIAAMPLSAELRLATPLRLVIHPQFEAQHLRDRVQELYQFYMCASPASFAKTMRKYGSRYIILEFKRCSFGPFFLDKYPDVNCKEGERPWKDLFCPRALASPLFEMLWVNAEFVVLRLRPKEEVPKGAKAGSVDDMKTWQPVFERCLAEEPAHCAARAADLALAFRKMGQPSVSQVLFQWAEQHGSNDGAYQYIMAFHTDYDLQQSQRAGSYYRRAFELEPNNPFFLKEYLMYLEIIAKDNRTAWRLLEPRRHSAGQRKSVLELGCPELACEASITARELFQDFDWSQELWNFALAEGPCTSCVDTNWALHNSGKKMRDELGDWNSFLNVFWHRKVKSTLRSVTSNGGRHGFIGRRPERTWGLRDIFAE